MSMFSTHPSPASLKLQDEDFQKVRKMIHDYCGIFIQEGKEALVRSRLMKRIRRVGVQSFSEYLEYVDSDSSGQEFLALVDVITTNKTNFFREVGHFNYIKNNIMPKMKGRDVKWWSAGCSSGEETVTMAITLLEGKQETAWRSVKILGTDISREILQTAKAGVYSSQKMMDVPEHLEKKYFTKVGNGEYKVNDEIRRMITYGRLNLTEKWPLKDGFHVIMCRNVMIYFNRETQRKLINRFYEMLEPGGYLFIGHSESIPSDNNNFVYVAPAAYQKR